MRGMICLDVGAGHGYVTGFLRELGADAFALDVDTNRLQEPSVKECLIRGDAMHMPIRDRSLDRILAFELVEHLKNPHTAIIEFYRCLKEGGTLLLTTPTPKSPAANYPVHISIRPRDAWMRLLKSIGFDVKIITLRYPVHFPHVPKMFNSLVGRVLGLWKRYFSVTSTKLVCTKGVRLS